MELTNYNILLTISLILIIILLIYFNFENILLFYHYIQQKYRQLIYNICYKKSDNYKFLNYNSKNVSIILTCTINVNYNINLLRLKNINSRKLIYIKSIKKWLKNTNFNIIVVENSNYDFKELEYEKKYYKNRFEIISFKENDSFKNIKSKGIHEFHSINYAYKNSNLIKNSNFIVKITGRYFIDKFESFINSLNLNNYYALRQNYSYNCEIVGCNIKYFNYIFSENIENETVEYDWEKRIKKLPKNKVVICPIFKIKPTINGGLGVLTEYL